MRKSAKTRSLLCTFACLLLLTLQAFSFQQPERIIKGKVTDENNHPLPGVSVTLQGSRNSVMTDLEGNFTITIIIIKTM